MSDNITLTKGVMLLVSSDIQSLAQADLTTELNAVSDKFNLASSQYQRYLELYHSAQTGLENAQELIDSLLNQSLANRSGYIQPNTGEFISEEGQAMFVEIVHTESAAKYELSKESVNEAAEVRSVATEVSSSVMFVSVGNVTLGIAGGMISRASFGLANARSIFVLVAGGLSVGLLGLFNALTILM
jgi:exonuclease VII small subunit